MLLTKLNSSNGTKESYSSKDWSKHQCLHWLVAPVPCVTDPRRLRFSARTSATFLGIANYPSVLMRNRFVRISCPKIISKSCLCGNCDVRLTHSSNSMVFVSIWKPGRELLRQMNRYGAMVTCSNKTNARPVEIQQRCNQSILYAKDMAIE